MNQEHVVIVSGGSRGLGRSIVTALLERGCRVATFSRARSAFIDAALAARPEQLHWAAVDAGDPAQLKAFVRATGEKFGGVHGLVNNAGIGADQLLPLTTDAEIDRLLDVNLKSALRLTRDVSRLMIRQRAGSIVTISSILGGRGFKGTTVYAATKAALDGMTRAAARELGAKGIRVNSIAPGFLETDMTAAIPEAQRAQIIRRTPLGRLGRVEEVARLALFLLSDE
ncbi:MAG TPA: SDR family oxidoreductase, partial [Opitutus sp.]|nr:SDR family oxidoreductase [Opitutus sp.]